MEYLKYILSGWLILMNLIAFVIMGVDKAKAKAGAWRVPEKTLFLFPILGGGIGGCLGMSVFRHKTKHWYFKYGFPLITILWIAGLVWLQSRYGIFF